MKNFKPQIFKSKRGSVVTFLGLCKGCGLCVAKCPAGAIRFSATALGVYSTPTIEVDLSKCLFCGLCETICPDCAVKVIKFTKKI